MRFYQKKWRFFAVTGVFLALFAVGFAVYALGHPERSWPAPLGVVYTIYICYVIVTVLCFVPAFLRRAANKKRRKKSHVQ